MIKNIGETKTAPKNHIVYMGACDNFNWMSHYTKEMVVEKTAIAPETSIYTLYSVSLLLSYFESQTKGVCKDRPTSTTQLIVNW